MAFSDWNFIAAWFAILGVMGWITFGVPCLVFGSLPDRIRNLRQAFVLGGLAGTAILLLFLAGLAAIFGRDLSTPDLLEASMLYIAYFGPCAFVFGGVGTATYIALLGRL